MILKDLKYDLLGIARAIIEGDSGNEYTTSIDLEMRRSWCSCPFYVYKSESPCKHILFLFDLIDRNNMTNKRKDLDFLPTGSDTLDKLLGGGVPFGIVTSIFGRPLSGKSMFNYQIGLSNLKHTKGKSLLIDTEGLREADFRSILNKFRNRWELDEDTVKNRFELMSTLGDLKLKSVQKLFMLFGTYLTWDISDEGGKFTPYFRPCTPTMDDSTWKDYSVVIIDSVTKPIKDSIGVNTQNLPARAQIYDRLFGHLFDIAMKHNIALLVTHHVSINPIQIYGKDFGKMWGGDPVLYNSKFALEFVGDAPKKLREDTGWDIETRRVKLVRRPDEQITGELFPIRLKKDWGYCDS